MSNELAVKEKVDEPVSLNIQNEIMGLMPTAGTLELTDQQKQILFVPPEDKSVEIRPDGLIYLPWMEYTKRLRDAFGCGWSMIPQGPPKLEGNLILWGFYLIIQGKLMGFSYGQQEYKANNPRMNWGDALEGAKSNALMRLCKGMGIAIELWQPSFVTEWKKKYAESYWEMSKKPGQQEEKRWRKKNTSMQDKSYPASEINKEIPIENISQSEGNDNDEDDFICPFKKHKGEKWEDILKDNPDYVQWVIDNTNYTEKERLKSLVEESLPSDNQNEQSGNLIIVGDVIAIELKKSREIQLKKLQEMVKETKLQGLFTQFIEKLYECKKSSELLKNPSHLDDCLSVWQPLYQAWKEKSIDIGQFQNDIQTIMDDIDGVVDELEGPRAV